MAASPETGLAPSLQGRDCAPQSDLSG